MCNALLQCSYRLLIYMSAILFLQILINTNLVLKCYGANSLIIQKLLEIIGLPFTFSYYTKVSFGADMFCPYNNKRKGGFRTGLVGVKQLARGTEINDMGWNTRDHGPCQRHRRFTSVFLSQQISEQYFQRSTTTSSRAPPPESLPMWVTLAFFGVW